MPAKSKSQQQFMGMVHACQKSGECASDEVKKVAGSIKDKDAEDFASTKHKGLPKRVKKDKKMSNVNEIQAGPQQGVVGVAQQAVNTVTQPVQQAVRGVQQVAGKLNPMQQQQMKKMKKKMKKEHMTFDEWLQDRDPELHEVATSTANVASFRRMVIPAVRRNNKQMPSIVFGNEEDTKKAKD